MGVAAAGFKDIPALNPNVLAGNTSTEIFDENGEFIARLGTEDRVPVKISNIPDNLKDAVLATEDIRFFQHYGVDLRAIARAAWVNIRGGELREGGSTITQQLVKISFLSPDRTFKRKIQEAILAIQLERQYSKEEILEMYLNRVYFGEGAYGVQSAAKIYFNKDINDNLTLAEAALLAGLPQAPSAYSPVQYPESALKRRNIVLSNMLKYNLITESQYNEAVAEEIKLDFTPPKEKYSYPFFIDYVTELLVNRYGEANVFKGGLKVYVTLDRELQEIAEKELANPVNYPHTQVNQDGIAQPQGAAVFIEPHTGYIKALVGGREHKQLRQFNRATQMHRQPGSTFKPIIAYGPAVEYKGLKSNSTVYDTPVTYGNWSPKNDDNVFRGSISLRTALAKSVNVVAAKLLHDVTIPKATKFAQGLGIESLDDKDTGLSIALGGLHKGVTPLELAGAYSAFANRGVYIAPTPILRVEKPDGTVLEDFASVPHRAMKRSTADIMTDMLQSVVERGTGTQAKMNRPVAGKTGTTDKGKDIWFAGYTPELAGVVWIGHDENKAMPHEYGGTYPARLWKKIVSQGLADVPVKPFPGQRAPDSVYVPKPDPSSHDDNDEDDEMPPKDDNIENNNPFLPEDDDEEDYDDEDNDDEDDANEEEPGSDITPGTNPDGAILPQAPSISPGGNSNRGNMFP